MKIMQTVRLKLDTHSEKDTSLIEVLETIGIGHKRPFDLPNGFVVFDLDAPRDVKSIDWANQTALKLEQLGFTAVSTRAWIDNKVEF